MTVVDAGLALGIRSSNAYRLAKETGKLTDGVPVLKIGHMWRVPTAALRRALQLDDRPPPSPDPLQANDGAPPTPPSHSTPKETSMTTGNANAAATATGGVEARISATPVLPTVQARGRVDCRVLLVATAHTSIRIKW
jgi:hypothetical protein